MVNERLQPIMVPQLVPAFIQHRLTIAASACHEDATLLNRAKEQQTPQT